MMDGIWPEDISPRQAADMIDYYVQLVGVEHVGIATDDISGLLLVAGIAAGMVSVWLLPIGLSLGFAVPLSRLSGMVWRRGALLDTDMTGQGAVIEAEAQLARASLRQALNVHPAE